SVLTHTATRWTYALSLHDALPISTRTGARRCWSGCGWTPAESTTRRWSRRRRAPCAGPGRAGSPPPGGGTAGDGEGTGEKRGREDRKSTRLNSSHVKISYAVFCLK